MQLRYSFRLYPAPGQRDALARAFGCARVVFNDALAARKAAHEAGQPYLTDASVSAALTAAKKTPERAWLGEVSSVVLQQAVADCSTAYRNFFASVSGKRQGRKVAPPRFRSRKDRRQTIRFAANARFKVLGDGRLRLPKIGDVPVRWSRELPAVPSSVTVIRDAAGRYFASFVVEASPEPLPVTDSDCGIDLGLGHFAVLDDGSVHLDLNPQWGAWNALRDDVPEGTEFAFAHPPYHSIIPYSGAEWGNQPHPDDLSRCGSYEEFLARLDVVNAKLFSSLRRGGRLAVLVGDVRRNGELLSLQRDLTWMGTPEAVIVKLQHNTASSRRSYGGKFVAIAHETVLVFRKDEWFVVPVRKVTKGEVDLRQSRRPTWRDLVQAALGSLGGQAHLKLIYDALAGCGRTAQNPHWQEKIRQVLQRGAEFEPLGNGCWRLVSPQQRGGPGRPALATAR